MIIKAPMRGSITPTQGIGLVDDEREGLRLEFGNLTGVKRGDLACDTYVNMLMPAGLDNDVASNVYFTIDFATIAVLIYAM
jgi:hypothetical protein